MALLIELQRLTTPPKTENAKKQENTVIQIKKRNKLLGYLRKVVYIDEDVI